MPDNVLPTSVQAQHINAFENAYSQRLSETDISVIMTYIVDLCPEGVLYYLASQWDVLGAKGWKFADTVQKKRDLVRNAIALNKIIGTPRSIITALNSLGILDVEIQENLNGAKYDATYTYNGSINYNQGYHWALFRVVIDTTNLLNLTGQLFLDIIEVVMAWKNERSWLEGLYFNPGIGEQAAMQDSLTLTGAGIYDGTYGVEYE